MELPFLRGTKGRILHLLRRGTLTADEVAAAVEVTPNGARFHLTELERDGLVAQRSVRRGPRKPSHGYSLTESGETLFPKRYDALLGAVLDDVQRARGADEVAALFRRLGHRLAAEQAGRFAGLAPGATAERAAVALRIVEDMGGLATVAPSAPGPSGGTGGGATHAGDASVSGATVVAGTSCPFKALVPAHPETCGLLEAFLADVLPQADVREACDKSAAPHCRFVVRPAAVARSRPTTVPTAGT